MLPDINILINNQKIDKVNPTNVLGVIVQHNLKWPSHIHCIQGKIAKSIGVMNKAKNVLSSSHLNLVYQSLIEPYLHYGCIIWANPDKSTILEVLHKLQKRAARVIVHANRRARSRPIFYKLHILNIYDLCLTQILLFVYKSINLLLPTRYNNYFTPLEKKHLYYTRGSKQNLHVLRATKTCRYNILRIRGHKYWNKLPSRVGR